MAKRTQADVPVLSVVDDDGPPDTTMVALGELSVDHSYQRPLDEAGVVRRVKQFDWSLFTEPEVNLREDGTIVILDGQQRCEAARRKFGDDYQIKVRVYYGLTLDQERRRYLAHNYYVKKATRSDTFRARLETGDPSAVAAKHIIEKHGYILHYGNITTTTPPGMMGSTTIEGMIRQYGVEIADYTIGCVTDAWGTKWNVIVAVLTGIASFLSVATKQEAFDRGRFVGVLTKTTARALKRDGMREASVRDTKEDTGVAFCLRDLYNWKLSEAKRVEYAVKRIPKKQRSEIPVLPDES